MRHVPRPGNAPAEPLPVEPVIDLPAHDISVQRLIDDSLLALSREVRNLLMLSAKGKLDPNSSRDLRDHLKLLFELKDREHDSLRKITDEQLKAEAKKVLDDNKQIGDPS